MIVLDKVSKSYPSGPVYKDFSLSIEEGKITCLLGASGCGKTTLLNMLAGLLPYQGRIAGVPGRVSYIFQEERLLPKLTVRGNVALVLGRRADAGRVSDILKKVELSGKEDAFPAELSGGQAQRVSIARAFAYPSGLILMDEPFASLDTALKIRLIGVFCRLWEEEKRTAVFVTHDADEALMLANRIVVLKGGRVAAEFRPEGSPCADLFARQSLRSELIGALL